MGVLRERRADRREPAARCAGRDVALAIDRGFLRLAAVPSFTAAAALRGLRSARAAGARDRGTRHDCPRRVAGAGRGGVFAEPVVADRRGGAGDRVRPRGDLHRRPVQRRAASGDGGRVGPVGGAFERCGLRRDHGSARELAPTGRWHGLLHRRLGLARLPRRRVHERRRGGPRPPGGGLDRRRAHGVEPARGLDGERRPGRSERERLRRRPLRPDRWSHAQPRGRDHARRRAHGMGTAGGAADRLRLSPTLQAGRLRDRVLARRAQRLPRRPLRPRERRRPERGRGRAAVRRLGGARLQPRHLRPRELRRVHDARDEPRLPDDRDQLARVHLRRLLEGERLAPVVQRLGLRSRHGSPRPVVHGAGRR